MQAPTHLALSWLIGHWLPERHDRRWVAWAGVLPDLDALAIVQGYEFYDIYHHLLTHGIVAAAAISALATAAARQRWRVLGLALLATHFHLLCDFFGSGPGWTIEYFYPFSTRAYFTRHAWSFLSWQNFSIGMAALVAIGWIGVKRGRTFAESFLPARADALICQMLRRWFSRHKS